MPNPTPNNSSTNYDGYLQSRTYSLADYDGPKTFTETWILTPKSGDVVYNNIANHVEQQLPTMVSQFVVPELGRKYSAWLADYTHNPAIAISPASGYFWQSAYCTNVDIQTTKTTQLIATFTFTARLCDGNAGSQVSFYPVNVEVVSGVRQMEAFRVDEAVDPPSNADSTTDIGGDPYMLGSQQGMMIDVPFIRYRLKRCFDATVSGHKVKEVAANYGTWTGTRNSATFMGLGIGKVVFESISITRLEGPIHEIAFDFIADSNYEHSQTPTFAVDGKPASDGTNLTDVIWKRPTRIPYDFNKVFFGATLDFADANVQASAERGYLEP